MLFGNERQILGRVSENFLLRALSKGEDEINRAIGGALTATDRWHKRDCPLKPVLVVWLVVLMALYRNLSIPNVFRRMLSFVQMREEGLLSRAVTPEALHHARRRLGPETLRSLFEQLSDANGWTQTHYKGHRAVGIDGTYFCVPDTPANEERFGRRQSGRGPAGYPQMQSVSLVDLTTHKILDVEFQHCHASEREALKELVFRRLGTGDLLLMDRGLTGFQVFKLCHDHDLNFLARLPSMWKPHLVKRLGVGDILVDIRPCKAEQDKMRATGASPKASVRCRMISYRIAGGETVRLLTSLLCPERYPADSLGLFYHQRWEIELVYDELKTHFVAVTHGKQPTHFRSKRPEGLLQEAYGMMVAYNLVRDLMIEAADTRHDLLPTQLSFIDVLETVKTWCYRLEQLAVSDRSRVRKCLLKEVASCRLRPRRHRRYPRKVKVKMSNFKRKRGRGGGEVFDAARSFQLVDV